MALTTPKNFHQTAAQIEFREKVSILIAIKRNADRLSGCLHSIKRQSYPHHLLELIIVEQTINEHARKEIREFIKANPEIRVKRSEKKRFKSSRKKTQYTDDDIVISIPPEASLAPDFVEKLVVQIKKTSAAGVGGRTIYQGDSYLRQAISLCLGSHHVFPISTQDLEQSGERREGVLHAGYTRGALNNAGILQSELIENDYEVATRMQQKQLGIHFSPEIVSHLRPPDDLIHLLGLSAWHGLSYVSRLRKQPGAASLRYVFPIANLLLGAVLAAGALYWGKSLLLGLAVVVLSYLLFNVGTAVVLAVRNGWKYLPAHIPVLAMLHFGFALGMLVGSITGKKWGTALPKWLEKSAVLLSDYLTINLAFFFWIYLRSELGLFALTHLETAFVISNFIFLFWMLVFLFLGLYRSWTAASRFEEALRIFKIVGVGVLAIYLFTFECDRDLSDPVPLSRMLLVSYWLIVATAVTAGRMIIRSIQRRLLENGIGLQRTLIVGWGKKARDLYKEIKRFPALGYRVIGFVTISAEQAPRQFQGVPVLGALRRLASIVLRYEAENVLIAPQKHDQKTLMRVIVQTEGLPVSLKIVPDMYSIITGQARTNQIYGFPLVEILPQYMPAWERFTKRAMDIGLSLLILLLGLPVWILVAIAIKVDSRGPVFYRQVRVGKEGAHFKVIKFRSMVADAEKATGPKWAEKSDPRVTTVGKFIRKWRIDEVPQFFNVLKGDMSIVGPRPERPYFVEKLRQEIPLYSRRLRVQPGITGWAQVRGAYDTTVENVKKKLQYDLFYLENMSLKMDMKIIFHTIYVMLAGRGQ